MKDYDSYLLLIMLMWHSQSENVDLICKFIVLLCRFSHIYILAHISNGCGSSQGQRLYLLCFKLSCVAMGGNCK